MGGTALSCSTHPSPRKIIETLQSGWRVTKRSPGSVNTLERMLIGRHRMKWMLPTLAYGLVVMLLVDRLPLPKGGRGA